jgi:hypothetical protein
LKKILLGIVIGVAGWQAYNQFDRSAIAPAEEMTPQAFHAEGEMEAPESFTCDGRVYCSQMTSCAEAEYFLQNCPGVKMDGGGDGVPCERQWCGDRN